MYRYTLFIPQVDNEGQWRPDFPEYIEDGLYGLGFSGWTELDGNGIWAGINETVRVYIVDSDDPYAEEKLLTLAEGFRDYALQEAVYFTKHPVETFVVSREAETAAVA